MADNGVVEQHAEGGQVLLDGRGRLVVAEGLDVGGDVERAELRQTEAPGLGPAEELRDGPEVSPPGVHVADSSREELGELFYGPRAGLTDSDREGGPGVEPAHPSVSVTTAGGEPGGRAWYSDPGTVRRPGVMRPPQRHPTAGFLS